MRLVILIAAATILQQPCGAFVPQKRPISQKSGGATASRPPVVFDQMGHAASEQQPPNDGFFPTTADTISEVDLGKEIFLANVEDNAQVSEVFEELNNDSSAAAVSSSVDMNAGLSDAVNAMNKLTTEDSNVNAILAASEEAAAIAEAKLASAAGSSSDSGVSEPAKSEDKNDAALLAAEANNDMVATRSEDSDMIEVVPTGTTEKVEVLLDSSTEDGVVSLTDIKPTPPDVVQPVVPTKPSPKKVIESPSVNKILKFAVPAIGVWLCSPLLSLIDTSAVGLFSGTVQQAALNPAVAVTDYAALLIAFMYTGTTNMIAAAREHDRGVEGAPTTSRRMVGALQLSTFVGAGLGAILFVFARTFLRAIIGNDGIDPAVFSAAMKYVRIRALGMPAAAMIGSAQAACLGMQDIRSPLYVLLAAAIVNFMGDMMFVGSSHPLIGGAAGAAWATVFSQYAAVTFFLRWLCKRKENKAANQSKPTMNVSNAILELTGKPTSANEGRRKAFVDAVKSFRAKAARKVESTKDKAGKLPSFLRRSEKKESKEPPFSVRGFLQGKLRPLDLVKLPPRKVLNEFSPYVVPVTTQQVGRVSGYIAMSHVVSSSLGTISMAAQQVIVSLFYCLCPVADSLSLTAQSFLPSICEKKKSKERAHALRKTAMNFLKAGGIFGAAMTAAVCCIPILSGFFTADPQVVSLVNSVAPWLIGWFSVHGVLCATEGILLGQKDLNFLGKMYGFYFAVVPYFMLRVKRAALSGGAAAGNINLTSVWTVMLGYQLFRSVAWLLRVAQLQLRTESQAPAEAAP